MDTNTKVTKINVPIMAEGGDQESIPSAMLELFTGALKVALKSREPDLTHEIELYFDKITVDKDTWTWRPEIGTLAINGKIHKVRTPALYVRKNSQDTIDMLIRSDITYGSRIVYIDSKAFLSDKKAVERLVRPEFTIVVPEELDLPMATKARLIKFPNFRVTAGALALSCIADAMILDASKVVHQMWTNSPVIYTYKNSGNDRHCKTLEGYLQHGFPRSDRLHNYHLDVTDEESISAYVQTILDILDK